jgi:hypothetical protein
MDDREEPGGPSTGIARFTRKRKRDWSHGPLRCIAGSDRALNHTERTGRASAIWLWVLFQLGEWAAPGADRPD